MYELKIIPKAQKDLNALRGEEFGRIKSKILTLRDNPRPVGSIKLTAQDGYRVRVGDYRVLYRIEEKEKTVYIYRIKARDEAYR